jgi:hypothetical protein
MLTPPPFDKTINKESHPLIRVILSDHNGTPSHLADHLSVGFTYSARFNGSPRNSFPQVLPLGFQNTRASLIGQGVVVNFEDISKDVLHAPNHKVYIDPKCPLAHPFYPPLLDTEIAVRQDVLEGVSIQASEILKPSEESCLRWAKKHYPDNIELIVQGLYSYLLGLSRAWGSHILSVADVLEGAISTDTPIFIEGALNATSVSRGLGIALPKHSVVIGVLRVSEILVAENFLRQENFEWCYVSNTLPATISYMGSYLCSFSIGNEKDFLRQITEILCTPCYFLTRQGEEISP